MQNRTVYNAAAEKDSNALGRKLREARKALGLHLPDISRRLELYGMPTNYKNISRWEKGDSIPNTYQFLALCKALEIKDALAFFTGEGREDLNEEGLRKLEEYRVDLVASGRYNKQSNIIRYIDMPVSNLSVSAGPGEFLDDGNYDMISVPAYTVPDGASFGVRVAGDSMEPVFHDGQLVWVQTCRELRCGEVGVMFYDGCGYLKAYDERVPEDKAVFTDSDGVLHPQIVMLSYNKEYEPKRVSPELPFEIVGRVLK